ncbi:MAG: ABC transporter ATP-binding protein/permease [Pseudodesulfovibrio sp.]
MNNTPPKTFSLFLAIREQISPHYRTALWFLLGGICLVALLETVTLGIIAFFATTITSPETALTSSVLTHIQAIIPALKNINSSTLTLILAIGVVVTLTTKNICQAATTYWAGRLTSTISSKFGVEMLNRFLHMPYEWHLKQNSSDLIISCSHGRSYIGFFLYHMIIGLSDIIIVLFMMGGILILTPTISIGVISVLGITGLIIFKSIKHKLDAVAKETMHWTFFVNKQVTLALHGVKDLMIFNRQDDFIRDHEESVLAMPRLVALQSLLSRSPAWILETVGFMLLSATVCMLLFYTDYSVARTSGTMALLAATAWRVLPAASRILSSLSQVRTSIPHAASALAQYVETENTNSTPETNDTVNSLFNEEIRVDSISFSYKDSTHPTLADVSLSIKKGQTFGIIGKSGSGKSTLVDIMIGLLPPTRGTVTVDKQDIQELGVNRWLNQIGYVPQTPYIFDGTLAENVAFTVGVGSIDREKVHKCCDMAHVTDFLKAMPEGIDTPIGERGVKISGGQRQRIAIARSLYKTPSVLILDEATSSLDTANERSILETVYGFKGALTQIIVAHRLTTVERCDTLIWLENGKIRMTGSPQDVLPTYMKTASIDKQGNTTE